LKSLESVFGPNSALVEELYKQYEEDPSSVPNHWKRYFDEMNGAAVEEAPVQEEVKTVEKKEPTKKKEPEPKKKKAEKPSIPESADVEKIKGVASKIVDNMDDSIYVPTATSLRVLPVKMMTEDRAIINTHLLRRGEPKASFTHLIAWAVIQGLENFPNINSYYANQNSTLKV
jgi:2-oxoglutarate dehydrogenase E1 component